MCEAADLRGFTTEPFSHQPPTTTAESKFRDMSYQETSCSCRHTCKLRPKVKSVFNGAAGNNMALACCRQGDRDVIPFCDKQVQHILLWLGFITEYCHLHSRNHWVAMTNVEEGNSTNYKIKTLLQGVNVIVVPTFIHHSS